MSAERRIVLFVSAMAVGVVLGAVLIAWPRHSGWFVLAVLVGMMVYLVRLGRQAAEISRMREPPAEWLRAQMSGKPCVGVVLSAGDGVVMVVVAGPVDLGTANYPEVGTQVALIPTLYPGGTSSEAGRS